MNEQNAADKDLLTIEELAAHAMDCAKEEAAAAAASDDAVAENTPADEDEEYAGNAPEDKADDSPERDEETDEDGQRVINFDVNQEADEADDEAGEKKESLTQQLRNFVDDEEVKSVKITPLLKALIGGDGLSSVIARNWLFLAVLVFFSCCYVSSRYMMQNATLERNTLVRTLADRKYKALTASSEYLEKTRSHYIESNLKDTTIHSSTDMPYALKIEKPNSNE